MKIRSFLFVLLSCFAFSSQSNAASVQTAKGNKVLINLEGTFVNIGDQFFLINPQSQKKAAIIQIQQVKGEKAVGQVLKGRALTGFTLQAKSSSLTGEAAPDTTVENKKSETGPGGIRPQWGYLGGYLQNTLDAKITYASGVGSATTSVGLSGTGLSVGVFYDYLLTKNLFFQGLAAYEQFSVKGSSSVPACKGTTDCMADINYLSFYGLLKWYMGEGPRMPWWIGGGGVYMMALSKSASALNENDISVNQAITLSGGLDYALSGNRYIPVSLHYNYFPDSPTVKASSIILRVGYSYGM